MMCLTYDLNYPWDVLAMKALIIDRDESAANLIRTRLEQSGAKVSLATVKTEAIDGLASQPVDIIFVDPAPLNNARQLVISIRRKIPTYTYIVLMGADITLKDAMAAGANDALAKPFVPRQVTDRLESADRLLTIQRRLNDPSEDFPSGGGVIAKSAFSQLFLAAIDRADRYAEETFIMFLSLRNYNQIKVNDTEFAADAAAAMLAQQLARIRRQSDILAQTGKFEYALLLQRPNYPSEPIEAAMRFAETLTKNKDIMGASRVPIELLINLIDVPSGNLMAQHNIVVQDKAAA
jgi:PleD family two-component response regulator